MNCNKIAFIICSNNSTYLDECLLYLDRLFVPDKFEKEVIIIRGAKSMLLGMEEGRNKTDAKYKVYMHQDVFILNRHYIENIISIFNADDSIGLIGVVGIENMPKHFAWIWEKKRRGWTYTSSTGECNYDDYNYSLNDGYVCVDCVDGMLMATAVDAPLRIDLLDGWDFYDVSYSFEMKKAGYKVIVPVQSIPWCLHDDGKILSLHNYNRYRKIAKEEYERYLYAPINPEDEVVLEEDIKKKIDLFYKCISSKTIEDVYDVLISEKGLLSVKNDSEIRALYKFLCAQNLINQMGTNENVFVQIECKEDLLSIDIGITNLLYRIASDNLEDDTFGLFQRLYNLGVPASIYLIYIMFFEQDCEEIICFVSEMYKALEDIKSSVILLKMALSLNNKSRVIAVKIVEQFLEYGLIDDVKDVIMNSVLCEDEEFKKYIGE